MQLEEGTDYNMALNHQPNIVRDGLILYLDAGNRKSFLPLAGNQPSLINTSGWQNGNVGATGFSINGQSAENALILSTDHLSEPTVAWETRPSGDGYADGGWEGSYFSIDRTKMYRSTVWVRKTSASSGGTFYHGLHTNGTNDTITYPNGTTQTNPYFDYRGTSSFTQNVWHLNVGHIYPYQRTLGGPHPDDGFYTVAGGLNKVSTNQGNLPYGIKFPADATQAYQRVYHYYCGDSTTRLQFANPRWDLIDGSEPSISELLTRSPSAVYDLSPYKNHHYIKLGNSQHYLPHASNPKRWVFDANRSITRTAALNGVTSACTVVVWYNTTEAQELWVRGQSDSYYVSASAANNYYHGNAGSPTNYIDLVTVANPWTPTNYKNGLYHMWEAKNVDLSGWTQFFWFGYPSGWQLDSGNVSAIMVYNRALTANESAQNFNALRTRYGI